EGERVRIVAQLIDVSSDNHIWANTYDRQMQDVFAIQSDVAEQIASALKATLSVTERERLTQRPTESLAAYDYYLRGRDYYSRYQKESNEHAATLFKKAIELDPSYAMAYAGLADTYNQRAHRFGFDSSWLDSANVLVDMALEIDPNCAATYKARGLTHEVRGHYKKALQDHAKATSLNPHFGVPNTGYTYLRLGNLEKAHIWLQRGWSQNPTLAMSSSDLADLHVLLEDYARAEELYQAALDLQPDFVEAKDFLANLKLLQGEFRYGLQSVTEILELNPDYEAAHWTIGFAQILLENFQEAKESLQKIRRVSDAGKATAGHFVSSYGSSQALLGYAYLREGNSQMAAEHFEKSLDAIKEQLNNRNENPWLYYMTACVLSSQGKTDEAYSALQQAVDSGWCVPKRARIDPMLQALRAEARFEELLSRLDEKIFVMRQNIEKSGTN
ncbi:hypothetical protein MJD09_21985, partial [bacterium]|nr:hypothetical protein [bacterium]